MEKDQALIDRCAPARCSGNTIHIRPGKPRIWLIELCPICNETAAYTVQALLVLLPNGLLGERCSDLDLPLLNPSNSEYDLEIFAAQNDVVDFVAVRAQTLNKDQQAT